MSRKAKKSEWTVDTLKEYVEAMGIACHAHTDDRFDSMEEATNRALHSAEKATDKTERLADLRAETQDRLAEATKAQQNEWRASLSDMTSTYVPRGEWDTAHKVMAEKLNTLERRHEADLASVRSNLSESKGKGIGQSSVVIWIFLGLTALISIIAVILDLSVPH